MDVDAFLAGFTGLWVYIVIGCGVGLASVAPPGWFVPGQTFALTGGVMASAGLMSIPAAVGTVFVGATVGCAIGYALGALFSARQPGWKPKGELGSWWEYALEMLNRRTGLAIVTGRWSAALRACVPNAAGVGQVGWGRFLAWNAVACAIWSAVVVGVGVEIHRVATATAQTALGVASALVFLAVTVGLVAGYRRREGNRTVSGPESETTLTGEIIVLTAPDPQPSEGDHQ